MKNPAVAVITRTKDRPIFLRRTIQSVLAQTYTDYVHVIINDGGDRNEVERIVAAVHDQSKLHLFHRDEASNAPDTILDESVRRVAADSFVIHDDDDSWHPDFLEITTKQLTSSSAGAVVAQTDKIVEELKGDTIVQKKRTRYLADVHAINLYRQCIDNQMTPIATLIRRSAYDEVGGYDSALPVCGDWDFGIRFLQKFDVDFVEPGYALAYYHHRTYKAGAQGNTSFAGNDKHRYWSNYLMNKYLREEIARQTLGVGYIMSKLRYDEHVVAQRLKKLLPSGVVESLKKRVR